MRLSLIHVISHSLSPRVSLYCIYLQLQPMTGAAAAEGGMGDKKWQPEQISLHGFTHVWTHIHLCTSHSQLKPCGPEYLMKLQGNCRVTLVFPCLYPTVNCVISGYLEVNINFYRLSEPWLYLWNAKYKTNAAFAYFQSGKCIMNMNSALHYCSQPVNWAMLEEQMPTGARRWMSTRWGNTGKVREGDGSSEGVR